jgi:hypothetical protein
MPSHPDRVRKNYLNKNKYFEICDLDHEKLAEELINKGFKTGRCPDCDKVLVFTLKPINNA